MYEKKKKKKNKQKFQKKKNIKKLHFFLNFLFYTKKKKICGVRGK